jgi:hypothetical protein
MWARQWKAMIPLRKIPDKIYEYGCHEGNYGMPGILGGARVQEEGEEDTAAKKGSR